MFFVAAAWSSATAQSGGITVRVVDPDGNPLPGANVTISHATGSVATTTEQSDAAGLVVFPVLRPGAGYSIQVWFPGMSPGVERDLRVGVGDYRRLTVQLFRQLSERIKIVADRQVIDIDKTEASTKFSDSFMNSCHLRVSFLIFHSQESWPSTTTGIA